MPHCILIEWEQTLTDVCGPASAVDGRWPVCTAAGMCLVSVGAGASASVRAFCIGLLS